MTRFTPVSFSGDCAAAARRRAAPQSIEWQQSLEVVSKPVFMQSAPANPSELKALLAFVKVMKLLLDTEELDSIEANEIGTTYGRNRIQPRNMISFIVPAHNEQASLGRTLEAIHTAASAVGQPYEIVVVDDASTDATPEIAAQNNARVVSVNHRQIASIRNSGARRARRAAVFRGCRHDNPFARARLGAARDGQRRGRRRCSNTI
jgi:glycosyl transferase family 2